MRVLSFSLAVVLVASLLGCSKGIDTVIPADVSTWEKELAPIISKLSEEERGLFSAYVLRAKMSSALTNGAVDIPFGTTIGQAIQMERERAAKETEEDAKRKLKEKEAQDLKSQRQAQRAEMEKNIHEAVSVTLMEKDGIPASPSTGVFRPSQRFHIKISNTSKFDISGVSGELRFIDLFGKDVGSVSFRIAESVAPGEEVLWSGARDYNEFNSEQKAVWLLDKGEFTTEFKPDTVVFSNGLKFEMPK